MVNGELKRNQRPFNHYHYSLVHKFLWHPMPPEATLVFARIASPHGRQNTRRPMHPHLTRRQFLESSLGASAMLGGGLAFLSNLQPVSAEDARLPSSMLRPDDGI